LVTPEITNVETAAYQKPTDQPAHYIDNKLNQWIYAPHTAKTVTSLHCIHNAINPHIKHTDKDISAHLFISN